jgi:hypothetical protein
MSKHGGARPGAGAPRMPIDPQMVRRLAGIGCTAQEIAVGCGVGEETLYARLRDTPEIKAAITEGREQGKTTLRRLQWQRAQTGSDTMLIWLGKQVLGQKDKTEITGEDGGPITYVIRAPAQVGNANEWLKLHGPNGHQDDQEKTVLTLDHERE